MWHLEKTKTVRAICRDDFSPKMTDMVRDAILNRSEFPAVCSLPHVFPSVARFF